MTQTNTKQEDTHALDQAKAQLLSIIEMVQALADADDDDARDEARQHIQEDPLCVEVRTGWIAAGSLDTASPEEYRILLCTGGPAVQIIGALDQDNQPETATLQYQDWFIPWADYKATAVETEALLIYAREFYYGEG